MTKETIGIRCSNPEAHPSHQVWRLTFNGRVLGDSRGYAKDRAVQEARQEVARDPANRELDETLNPERPATMTIDPKATPTLQEMSGEEITECLAALDWTQATAAAFFDVDRRTVLRWCNDQKPIPAPVAMLLRLLVAGDVTAAAFIRADRPADSAMIDTLEQQARAAAQAGNGPELGALLARLEIMCPPGGKHDRFKTLCDDLERIKPMRKATSKAKTPAPAAPEAPTSPLTDLERQALQGILASEYMDGMKGQDAVGHQVWSWSANPFKSKRTFAGAISSLVQKGFVDADDATTKANDRTLAITQKGMDAFLGRTATHVSINHASGERRPYQIMVHYAAHPAVVWGDFEDLTYVAAAVDRLVSRLGVPLKGDSKLGGVK